MKILENRNVPPSTTMHHTQGPVLKRIYYTIRQLHMQKRPLFELCHNYCKRRLCCLNVSCFSATSLFRNNALTAHRPAGLVGTTAAMSCTFENWAGGCRVADLLVTLSLRIFLQTFFFMSIGHPQNARQIESNVWCWVVKEQCTLPNEQLFPVNIQSTHVVRPTVVFS